MCAQKKNAWLEVSKSNRSVASYNKIKLTLDSIISNPPNQSDQTIITLILAAVNSERADSSNRHSFLWKSEYRLSGVDMTDISYNEKQHVHTKYNREWVKDKINFYIKGKSANNIKILTQQWNYIDEFDMSDLLHEIVLTNVAELVTLHADANTKTLKERINCIDQLA
ncbi:hypothetical protein G6F36_013335 [Rhizopus arrhizus]|nr:hypothetical protein G6F36_013335 [Rhizopus arrhizus]